MNLKYIISAILGALVASSYFLIIENTQIRSEATDFSNGKDDIGKPLVHIKEPAVLLSESDSLEELEALRSQNTKLLSTIEKLEQKIQIYAALDNELSIARASVDKLHLIKQVMDAKKPEREWLDKEIEDSYPAPFDAFMKASHGFYREMYQDFQYEPIDQEWAFKLETQIRDFIQLNELGNLVEISVLDCKSYRCQLGLMVKETERKPWKAIFDQMTLEPWFKFNTHYSSPLLDESFNVIGNFFFMQGLPDGD